MSGAKTQPDDLAPEEQFAAEVFPAEIGYIAERRKGSDDELSQSPTVENGLLGLAFSGGGIRSATFNLGVLQELHRRGLFKRVDLLSTVSGGGFIGSCLTSLMSRGRDFPFDDGTAEETPAVSHLRNNSNYLAPRGVLDYLRMFAVLLRGIILNFLVLVPILLALSLVATLWYGPQLLSRLRYDETVERTFRHLEAADLGEAGLEVDVGKPVAPLLDLLETHALVEFADAGSEGRRNARVTDALLDRDDAYRDVTEPLITGTGSVAAPYTFRAGVTPLQVAQRLVDAGRVQGAGKIVEAPGKIEEIRAVEQTLTRDGLSLGQGVGSSEVDALLGHLTKETRDTEEYLPQPGTSDPARLFMVFVTRQTLVDVLKGRGIIIIDKAEPITFTPTPGDDEERRYSLTQILQAFYDARLFDRRWLQEQMSEESAGDLDYRWYPDERTHLEVEAAAFALWDDLGTAAESLSVERLFAEMTAGSTLLKAVPDAKSQRALLAALQTAGVVKRTKSRCWQTSPANPTKLVLSKCEFVDESIMRLPAVFYEQRAFNDNWFRQWRQSETKNADSGTLPDRALALVPWFASTDELHYVRDGAVAEREREIGAAEQSLALDPGLSVEALIERLDAIRRSRTGTPLVAGSADPRGILSALTQTYLVRDDEACSARRLERCVWVDAADGVANVPRVLYEHELYERAWFDEYFASDQIEVVYQRARAEVLRDAERELRKARKQNQEVQALFEWFEQTASPPATKKLRRDAYRLIRKRYLIGDGCPMTYRPGGLTDCRFEPDSEDAALHALYDGGYFELLVDRPEVSPAVETSASPFNRGYDLYIRPVVEQLLWNPNRLHLPLTTIVALGSLVLVLAFPLATMAFGPVVQDRIDNRDRLERVFGACIIAIGLIAFFELQPYLIYHWRHLELTASWSVVVAAASVVSTIAAGPALSHFKKFGRTLAIMAVSILGPLLPFMIYLAVMNQVIYGEIWRSGNGLNYGYVVLFFLTASLVVHVFVLTVDPNSTGMHSFYKDRLSRAYLVGKRGQHRSKEAEALIPTRDLELTEMCPLGSEAPYHLVNVALNLQGSDDPSVRDRRSDSFIFSKLFVGGGRRTGYCRTDKLNEAFSRIDLGTAMAVSGGAAAPNMGAFTVGPLVPLLALLNIRLGYWLPNPRAVRSQSEMKHSGWRRLGDLPARLLGRYRVRPGPYLFLRELLSQVDDKGRCVNVSDGGHFENTAIYELLRRRCQVIIAGDAEADHEMNFAGLATLQRYARIDLGIEIDMDTRRIRPAADLTSGVKTNARHFAVGTIHYPASQSASAETGYLIYLKSSLTGEENQVISEYAGNHASFPHESTADQFFGEGQFEAYRDLGRHVAESAFAGLDDTVPAEREVLQWLSR